MNKKQTRFKSPVAIASVVILLLNQLGLKEIIGLDEGAIRVIIDSVFAILVTLGIFNNPTSKTKF